VLAHTSQLCSLQSSHAWGGAALLKHSVPHILRASCTQWQLHLTYSFVLWMLRLPPQALKKYERWFLEAPCASAHDTMFADARDPAGHVWCGCAHHAPPVCRHCPGSGPWGKGGLHQLCSHCLQPRCHSDAPWWAGPRRHRGWKQELLLVRYSGQSWHRSACGFQEADPSILRAPELPYRCSEMELRGSANIAQHRCERIALAPFRQIFAQWWQWRMQRTLATGACEQAYKISHWHSIFAAPELLPSTAQGLTQPTATLHLATSFTLHPKSALHLPCSTKPASLCLLFLHPFIIHLSRPIVRPWGVPAGQKQPRHGPARKPGCS